MDTDKLKQAVKFATEAREAIYAMTYWHDTQDGGEYWSDVAERLQRIATNAKRRLGNHEGKL